MRTPGFFTLSGQGTGQAAVLNNDAASGSYTINSSQNTAPLGSRVVIFAPGLGTLQPAGLADGLAAPVAHKVLGPLQVTPAGQPCVVTYGGTSPGSLGGLTQINAIVSPTVATGRAVPITIAEARRKPRSRARPALRWGEVTVPARASHAGGHGNFPRLASRYYPCFAAIFFSRACIKRCSTSLGMGTAS
jgi:hypothetical protein